MIRVAALSAPVRIWCSEDSCTIQWVKVPPTEGPVTVVVISSSEEGDQLVESLDVKALVARGNPGQIRQRGERPDRP